MGTSSPTSGTTRTNDNMKQFIVCCLVAVALGSPQLDERVAQIIRQDISPNEGGNFQHDVETDNGILVSGSGVAGSAGQSNMQGSYSYTAPDGTPVQVSYRCDELGCVYDSPFIPVAPAAPPHVAELLRIAEEQRAQGITF